MLVRMISQISGGRADGRIWPEGGSVFETSDSEGFDLVRGGMATPGDNFAAERLTEMGLVIPEPLPSGLPGAEVPAADGPGTGAEEPPAEEAEPAAAAADAAAAEPAAEAGGTGDALAPPAPHDNKQAWIDYAVSRGEDPATAEAMVKADLMSKYGGRL